MGAVQCVAEHAAAASVAEHAAERVVADVADVGIVASGEERVILRVLGRISRITPP